MRALRLPRFGGPELLEKVEVPAPQPAADQVLIEVAYCGVCRHDLLTRAGAFPRIDLPVTLGHQVSGRVAAVGSDVEGLAPGDRVMTMIYTGCGECAECRAGNQARCLRERPRFLGEDVDGGYAEYVAVRQDIVVPVPAGVRLAEAAVITCTLGTAYHALATRGQVADGQTVAITGASGGVGLHAIMVAKVLGARVFAVTSSPNRVELVADAGADEVVVASDRRFARAVKELTDGRGVDAVIDVVGGPTLNESIHAARDGGRVVVTGNVEGGTVELRPAHLILKELALVGTKSCSRPELEEVLDLLCTGRLSVDIDRTFPLEQGAELHRSMEEGTAQGRLVMQVAGERD